MFDIAQELMPDLPAAYEQVLPAAVHIVDFHGDVLTPFWFVREMPIEFPMSADAVENAVRELLRIVERAACQCHEEYGALMYDYTPFTPNTRHVRKGVWLKLDEPGKYKTVVQVLACMIVP